MLSGYCSAKHVFKFIHSDTVMESVELTITFPAITTIKVTLRDNHEAETIPC